MPCAKIQSYMLSWIKYFCAMNILLVAASKEESDGINLEHLESCTAHTIKVLVTGVGMAATTYAITKALAAEKFDLAINIGLAGSFNEVIAIGELVNITSDTFGDIGAEDNEKFLT